MARGDETDRIERFRTQQQVDRLRASGSDTDADEAKRVQEADRFARALKVISEVRKDDAALADAINATELQRRNDILASIDREADERIAAQTKADQQREAAEAKRLAAEKDRARFLELSLEFEILGAQGQREKADALKTQLELEQRLATIRGFEGIDEGDRQRLENLARQAARTGKKKDIERGSDESLRAGLGVGREVVAQAFSGGTDPAQAAREKANEQREISLGLLKNIDKNTAQNASVGVFS